MMKGCLLLTFCISFTFQAFAQTPDFSIAGFATQNGGTTGGQGGTTVTATTYSQLKSYAESTTSYIILVEDTISNGTTGAVIRVESNKSIIGTGSTALLQGIALNISSKNNIIIQNLGITLLGLTTPKNINDGDCIGIQGTSMNIWIDHCELYSEDPAIQTNIDKYDGLIDIKNQTGFITISWCYLHDHHKGGLVGSSDTDLGADRKITYHHNYYNKVRLRVPMYRGSVGHFFNNYIVGATDASEIRIGACVRIEKNYYETLHYAIYTPNDAKGMTERIDNVEVSKPIRAYPENCVAVIPYDYSAFLTNTTNDVKTIVPQYAGVGKITDVVNSLKEENGINSVAVHPNPFVNQLTIQQKGFFRYHIFSLDGKGIESGHASDAVEIGAQLHPGFYILRIQGDFGSKSVKISKVK